MVEVEVNPSVVHSCVVYTLTQQTGVVLKGTPGDGDNAFHQVCGCNAEQLGVGEGWGNMYISKCHLDTSISSTECGDRLMGSFMFLPTLVKHNTCID